MSIVVPLLDPSSSSNNNRAWDSQIDDTILRLETHQKHDLSKTALKTYLDALYQEVNVLSDLFTIEGPALGNRFAIQFSGAPGLAKTHRDQASTSHREETGKYKELAVDDPAGASTRIYINPDENPKQIRTRD